MSDPAPDLPDVVPAPDAADQSPPGSLHTVVKSPTLVPSPHPGSKDDVAGQAEPAILDVIADSIDPANWPHGPVTEPQVAESPTEAREGSEDLLKLLQQLAQRTSRKDTSRPMPAAPMDARLASYLSGIVDGLNSPGLDVESQVQVPARKRAPYLKGIALAGCLAILGAGIVGVFWSNRIAVVSEDGQPEAVLPASSHQDSTEAAQARRDDRSVQIANQCDLPGLEANQDTTYVIVSPMPLSNSSGPTSGLSGEDRGWYSLMSLMARPEPRSAGC